MAIFDKAASRTFRSTIKGREEIGVGRNIRSRDCSGEGDWKDVDVLKENIDWEKVWGRESYHSSLPKELRDLQ